MTDPVSAIAALRAAIAELPETADIVIEDSLGWRYDVKSADVWGRDTEEGPYVRLLLWHPQDPRKCPGTHAPDYR